LIKLLGAFLMVGVTTWIGANQSFVLRRREHTARDFAARLEQLGAILSFKMDSIPAAIEELLRGEADMTTPFFTMCLVNMEQLGSLSFCEIWSRAMESAHICLGSRERREVMALGEIIGRYGVEAQLNAIMSCVYRLRSLADEQAVQNRQKGKLYTALGVCSGLMAVIVLI